MHRDKSMHMISMSTITINHASNKKKFKYIDDGIYKILTTTMFNGGKEGGLVLLNENNNANFYTN